MIDPPGSLPGPIAGAPAHDACYFGRGRLVEQAERGDGVVVWTLTESGEIQ